MSLFVQQNHSCCDFSSKESWIILSAIEQSIKRKIEAVGIPLKEWNIKINYGIKTGFNDAFIVSTEKREEILSNCIDEDERERTAAIIRPLFYREGIHPLFQCVFLFPLLDHRGVQIYKRYNAIAAEHIIAKLASLHCRLKTIKNENQLLV